MLIYVVEIWHKKTGTLFSRKFYLKKQIAINAMYDWSLCSEYELKFYDVTTEDKEESK